MREGVGLVHGGGSAGDDYDYRSSSEDFVPHEGITQSDHHDSRDDAAGSDGSAEADDVVYGFPPLAPAVVLGDPGSAVVHSRAGVVVHGVALGANPIAYMEPDETLADSRARAEGLSAEHHLRDLYDRATSVGHMSHQELTHF